MNFTCTRKDLAFGVKTVSRALGAASVMPILAGIRLDVQPHRLTLHATDLERALSCHIPLEDGGDGEGEGEATSASVVLNGEVLGRLVGVLPEETVRFQRTAEGNKVELLCGGTTFDLLTLPLEDYPQIPILPQSPFCTLQKGPFQKGIHLTNFAALSARETSRLSLTGVDLVFQKDRLRLAATNGYRLALYEIPLSDGPEGEFLVDAGALRDLGSILAQVEDEQVTLYRQDSQLFFQTSQVTFVARSIEEEYPDFDKVIPQDNPIGLALDRSAFLAALQRAQITTAEESGAVVLQADEQRLRLSSSSSEKGETEEVIPLLKPVESVQISFKAEYLIEALKRMTSDQVTLWLADAESAGLLEPSGEGDDEGFIYVCMPIRLDL